MGFLRVRLRLALNQQRGDLMINGQWPMANQIPMLEFLNDQTPRFGPLGLGHLKTDWPLDVGHFFGGIRAAACCNPGGGGLRLQLEMVKIVRLARMTSGMAIPCAAILRGIGRCQSALNS